MYTFGCTWSCSLALTTSRGLLRSTCVCCGLGVSRLPGEGALGETLDQPFDVGELFGLVVVTRPIQRHWCQPPDPRRQLDLHPTESGKVGRVVGMNAPKAGWDLIEVVYASVWSGRMADVMGHV